MTIKKIVFILIVCLYIVGCSREEIIGNANGQVPVNDSSSGNNGTENNEVDGPNILENGGLERWDMVHYNLYMWSISDARDVTRNYGTMYEGLYSAKMKSITSGTTSRICQSIPVTPNSKIRIRFRYYVEQWKTNGSRTYCYFRTKATEASTISISELREFYSNDEYYIIRGGGYGLKYLPHTLNEWLTFNETITVPPTATYFVFGVNSYYGTTIYVDDCFVGEMLIQ